MKINKKANQIGVAIIIMALLLLLGGIFIDDGDYISKKDYIENKNIEDYPENYYLFYLNETDIGRQKKVTESFPNIELGSIPKPSVVYIGNNFILSANPFNKNTFTIEVDFSEPENVKEYLIYFSPEKTGSKELIISIDGKMISKNLGREQDLPIKVYKDPSKNQSTKITFELEKPKWYQIFSWNKLEVNDLKIVEVIQNENNNHRKFDFELDKKYLETIYVELALKCQETKEISEAIEVIVNGNIISNQNPDCTSRYNKISAEIPLNILKENEMNRLELNTEGHYSVAYSLNKIYFNDKDLYKFTINDFSDIIDVIMYGDFDKERIELRINSQTINLYRDELVSIVPYLKFGTNELRIITKPVEIKELIIEKNEYLYS